MSGCGGLGEVMPLWHYRLNASWCRENICRNFVPRFIWRSRQERDGLRYFNDDGGGSLGTIELHFVFWVFVAFFNQPKVARALFDPRFKAQDFPLEWIEARIIDVSLCPINLKMPALAISAPTTSANTFGKVAILQQFTHRSAEGF